MTDPAAFAANTAWCVRGRFALQGFEAALQEPEEAQARVLKRILLSNTDSEFGKQHGFTSLRCADAFRERVPLATFEDFREAVDRIARGATKVLTGEPVTRFVPTSGSTLAKKWIPFTRSLSREFSRAIEVWVGDLSRSFPGAFFGKSWWMVSPLAHEETTTPAGIPVGMPEDAGYLGPLGRHLLSAVLAVPGDVRFCTDLESFRYLTLFHLLRCRSLSLLSFWHPTFLLLLLEPLVRFEERLAADIASGRVTYPVESSRPVRLEFRKAPARARELGNAFRAPGGRGDLARHLWPDLGLVSCWLDAHAAPYRSRVSALFPQAALQPKGLLATEGIVTIPLTEAGGGVPAVQSHFFEFLESETGESLLVNELARGARYEIVLTTGGGLYRYRLGDTVEVERFHRGVPVLRFLGRGSEVSDHRGEKLNEEFVRTCMEKVWKRIGQSPSLAFLAFEESPSGYVLFEDGLEENDPAIAAALLEDLLSESYHYAMARRLGQLGPVRSFDLHPEYGARAYFDRLMESGRRPGEVKVTALSRETGWCGVLPERRRVR